MTTEITPAKIGRSMKNLERFIVSPSRGLVEASCRAD